MAKIKVVLIEDEFFAAEHLRDVITDLGFWVTGVYHSGEQFLEETRWDFDAAVVDIFLSDKMSGLDVAKHMQEHHKPFLFLTANQDNRTLKEAARLNPSAYISKPFKKNDVSAALEMIALRQPKMLQIRGANGVEELNPSQVLFIKSDGAYIEIHTNAGMVVQRKLLKDIVDDLPTSFVRLHRSYLVNTDYLEQRSATQVTIKGHQIPVSRSYKENLELL